MALQRLHYSYMYVYVYVFVDVYTHVNLNICVHMQRFLLQLCKYIGVALSNHSRPSVSFIVLSFGCFCRALCVLAPRSDNCVSLLSFILDFFLGVICLFLFLSLFPRGCSFSAVFVSFFPLGCSFTAVFCFCFLSLLLSSSSAW